MDLLTVGLVRTVHGVRGALKVRSTSGEMEHFRSMQSVWLVPADKPDTEAVQFRLESVHGAAHAIIVKLEGIESPEAAVKWRGARVLASRDDAAECNEDEFYVADLVGCTLLYGSEPRGSVVGVWETGAADMLEVQTGDGIRNVPFRKEFIGEVDTRNRTLELLTDWILE